MHISSLLAFLLGGGNTSQTDIADIQIKETALAWAISVQQTGHTTIDIEHYAQQILASKDKQPEEEYPVRR